MRGPRAPPPRERGRQGHIGRPAAPRVSRLFDEYMRYRDMLSGMHNRIMRDHVDDGRLDSAASLLGIGGRKEIDRMLETEKTCVYEFAVYDLRRGGRTALESYVESLGGIDGVSGAMRRRLLRAMLAAKTSCYAIESTNPGADTVVFRDVIGGGGKATVHDRGMSYTGRRGVGVFTRIVALPRLSMLAGGTMPFASSDLRRAVSVYRKLEKRSSRRPEIKRYALFFRLFRKYGGMALYRDARTGEVEVS